MSVASNEQPGVLPCPCRYLLSSQSGTAHFTKETIKHHFAVPLTWSVAHTKGKEQEKMRTNEENVFTTESSNHAYCVARQRALCPMPFLYKSQRHTAFCATEVDNEGVTP